MRCWLGSVCLLDMPSCPTVFIKSVEKGYCFSLFHRTESRRYGTGTDGKTQIPEPNTIMKNLIWLSFCILPAFSIAAEKPNVLFVICDDLNHYRLKTVGLIRT